MLPDYPTAKKELFAVAQRVFKGAQGAVTMNIRQEPLEGSMKRLSGL
jgi:hypothetical protein